MQDSWKQNFWRKDEWQVALTGCWRSSETRAQWTDVKAAADSEVSAQIKTTPPDNRLFTEPLTFSEVNKYAFKKLLVLFIIFLFFSTVKDLWKLDDFTKLKLTK